jgi:hypothetical protein
MMTWNLPAFQSKLQDCFAIKAVLHEHSCQSRSGLCFTPRLL